VKNCLEDFTSHCAFTKSKSIELFDVVLMILLSRTAFGARMPAYDQKKLIQCEVSQHGHLDHPVISITKKHGLRRLEKTLQADQTQQLIEAAIIPRLER